MDRSLKISSIILGLGMLNTGCSHFQRTTSTEEFRIPEKIADMDVTQIPDSAKVFANAGYHFTMAQAYSGDGQSDRAIEEYKLALIYDPDSSMIYSRLANEYLRKGLTASAMEVCKEGLSKHEEFVELRMLLAGLFAMNRQQEEAITQYKMVLKKEPTHEEAAVYKAQTHLELEQVEEAEKTLTTFLKAYKNSAMVWYYLGRVAQIKKQFVAAEKSFKTAIELKKDYLQAELSLAFLYEENNKTDKAVEVYKNLFETTQDISSANRLVTILLKAEKFEEALPYLQSLENLDHDDLNAQVKLGLVYMELKKWTEAEKIFKQILVKNPDSDRILFYLGNLYEETKKEQLAVETLMKINPSSKLYTDAVLHSAQILKNSSNKEGVIKFMQTALTQSSKTLPFYIYLASIFEENLKLSEAIETLENAYKIFPDDQKVLYYLGSLYDRTGEVDKGIAKMEQLLFLNPMNADALNYLGYTYSSQGKNLDKAELLLKKALEINPKNAFILDSWGFHLMVRGKTAKAIPFFEKAIQLKGDESVMLEHLGDAYAKLNLTEKALSTYLKASSIAKEDSTKQSVAKKIDSIRVLLAQTGKSQSRRPASVSVNKIKE